MKKVTYYPEDIPEENFIPIAKKVKFSWTIFVLMNIYFFLMGLGIGWLTGYTKGLEESIRVIEKVQEILEKPNDGITEGHMPW